MSTPLQFPKNDEAKARLKARRRSWQSRPLPASDHVTRHPSYDPERDKRIRADEKARAMPERLMFYVLIAVIVLTVTPVALLALVGY